MPKFEIDYNDFKNTDQIQKFINRQLWSTGANYNTNSGATVTSNVKWGGQSRFLAGFNFFANNPTAHSLSIVLNQETIIDNVPLIFLQPLGNLRFIQYFEFIRPLSGADTMVISTTSTTSETVYYNLYMTRAYNKYYVRD
jgi:hypothetical protein